MSLEQTRAFEMGDDVTYYRLGPVEMARQLTDGHRPGQRQMLEHRPRRRGKPGTLAVPAVEPQVDRGELLGELLCGASGVVHAATM